MSDIRITGMTIMEKPGKQAGYFLYAYFNYTHHGYRVSAAAFQRTADGRLGVSLPGVPARNGVRRAFQIHDNELRQALIDAAKMTYERMGGDLEAYRWATA